jgi:hypothetical protein
MARSQSDATEQGHEHGAAGRRKSSLIDPDRAVEGSMLKGPSRDQAEPTTPAQRETRIGERRGRSQDRRAGWQDPDRIVEGRARGELGDRGERDRDLPGRDRLDADRLFQQSRKGEAEPTSPTDRSARHDAETVRSVYVDTSISEISNISASTRTIEEELRYQGPRDGAHSAFAHRQVQGQLGEVMAGKYLEQQGYRPISPHGRSAEHGLDHIAWSPSGDRLFIGESKNHDSTSGYETGDREPGDRKGIWLDDHEKVRQALEQQTRELPKDEREKALNAFDERRVDRGVFLYGDTRPSPKLIERAKAEGWTIYQLKPRVKTYDRVTPRDEVE